MKQARCGLLLLLVAMILLGGMALEAAEPMVRSEGPAAASPVGAVADTDSGNAPVKMLGVQVFIDPKTGLIRTPTPDEAAALAAEMQRRIDGSGTKAEAQPKQVVLANGTVMTELDPSLYSVSGARILPDGTVSYACVEDHDHETPDPAPPHTGAETE